MSQSDSITRESFIRRLCAGCAAAGLAVPAIASTSSARAAAEDAQGKKFRLLEEPQIKREFGDVRSNKVIFLAHCMMNMNARMHRCARVWPSVVKPIAQYCMDNEIGIVQMPCPELLVTGLGRDRDDPPVNWLREALEKEVSRERIRELARQVVFQMKEYRFQGFTMIAVVGNDGSPSCGVDITAWPDPDNRFAPGQGVFFQELQKLMEEAGIELPFKGIDDEKTDEMVAWIDACHRQATAGG